ncbi:MAG: hypothetical protein ACJ8FS_04625 [Sphingomicrobium sp.]
MPGTKLAGAGRSGNSGVVSAPASPISPVAAPGDPLDSSALAAAGVGTGPIGAPGPAPGSGPVGGSTGTGTGTGAGGGGSTPIPSPGPGTGGSASNGTGSVDDAFATAAGQTFFDAIKSATTPEALEAQNIILRRIALQGDVVPSRVPPPRNITEIGGYLNLLTTLNELDMRSQVLAGILGVAGPNPPLGWIGAATPLTFTPLLNDRPAGPLQASLPVAILVRSDFVDALRSAQQALHDRACVLPFMSGPLALPPAGAFASATLDPLDYIGRTLRIAAGAALSDPETDPLALVRPAGSSDSYQLAVRSAGTGPVPVAPADFEALQKSPTGFSSVTLTGAPMVMLKPILDGTGFVVSTPLPQPTDAAPAVWATLKNIGGLAAETRLGDELRLLHSPTEISGSAFASWLNWRWNGAAFAP